MFETFHPLLVQNTPFLFFTGKGGVGKTSTASATAVALADSGKRVLIVSTDPASNLQDVFGMELSNAPQPVQGVANLFACNLDPEAAALSYRESVIGPYRDKLPEVLVQQMEEQLSGACTVEIAAFDEFTNLLANESFTKDFDHILFDTAPTGHTLRLLNLPTAWSGFLDDSTHGASCLGPLAGLDAKRELYAKTVDALANPDQTTLILVARPDEASFREANRASSELMHIGIRNQLLLVNGVYDSALKGDAVSEAFYSKQQQAIASMPTELADIPTYSLPFVPYSLTGMASLRQLFAPQRAMGQEEVPRTPIDALSSIQDLVDDYASNGTRVLMTMGKGGVGKTSTASLLAVGLVEKGLKVHLTTTDPAAHLMDRFQNSGHQGLTISRIDPVEQVELYKAEVMNNAGELDEEARAYLEEDLRSPCTEEIAVFRAFADLVARADDEIVIIDTAPTGHTLLLLDAAQSYHKEMSRATGEVPESVRSLLPRLRNPKETAVILVTLPEATPVFEAARLQEDLKRAGIMPRTWIINQSLYGTATKEPILLEKARTEQPWIQKVSRELAETTALIPWQAVDSIGYDQIKQTISQ
ncbi:MAG TPA: arsenical pump-driving ATPase [Planococcus sp. (in: firmicutes)]|nr:arsenical pump-driving ATPase [Planococcus sp. (in: firmicutes)]